MSNFRDIIRRLFEFYRGENTEDYELFTEGCEFTDDLVMTVTVAEPLIEVGLDASKEEI